MQPLYGFFCRACIAACPSDQETVSDNGKLTLQRLSPDFRQAVENGWEWLVLSAEVDDGGCSAALAGLLRAGSHECSPRGCKNGWRAGARHGDGDPGKVARRAKLSLTIDWDVVQAEVAATVPDASPQTVAACGLFCRFYGGGSEAPLLKFLHDFSRKYGASKRLGEEFMSTVAGLRVQGRSNPMLSLGLR